MFAPSSRYYPLPTTTLTTADGQKIAYVRRRFLPQPHTFQIVGEIAVNPGDRLDHITFRALGDPEQYWQICDASNAMNPSDLTHHSGQWLRVPMPQV